MSAMYGDHDIYEVSAASRGRVNARGYSLGATWYNTEGISLASRCARQHRAGRLPGRHGERPGGLAAHGRSATGSLAALHRPPE